MTVYRIYHKPSEKFVGKTAPLSNRGRLFTSKAALKLHLQYLRDKYLLGDTSSYLIVTSEVTTRHMQELDEFVTQNFSE